MNGKSISHYACRLLWSFITTTFHSVPSLTIEIRSYAYIATNLFQIVLGLEMKKKWQTNLTCYPHSVS
jgi:hypothetical protein